MEKVIWKGVSIISLLVAFVALIIGIVAVDKASILLSFASVTGINGGSARSCKDLKGKSGIYKIQPDKRSPAFQTYCDMEVSGGGWTLVASIHENNIDGKCTPGDKWSSEQGSASIQGSKNWENRNIFGKIDAITDQDYKNPAYYSLDALDIMLWHVPNEKKVYEISSAAKLKYYTKNGFLNKTSLQYLFSEKFPLKTAIGGLEDIFKKLRNQSSSLTASIPNWHRYRYDSGVLSNNIRDGGGDMYDGGNRVAFGTNRENFTTINYNTPYFLYGSGIEIKSEAIYPFVSLAWIGSGLGDATSNVNYFEYRVISNFGADGRGRSITYPTKGISLGQMTANYTAFNVINASDPSICEVYFYITNPTWSSIHPNAILRIGWQNQTRVASNIVRFTGGPSNILVGYTLLSKANGLIVRQSEIETVLRSYMQAARKRRRR